MNDDRETMLPSLRVLGDSLGEAARREIGAAQAAAAPVADAPSSPQRWLRRHGRATGIVAGVLLAAAGAATAGDLISSGEPLEDQDLPSNVRPAAGSATPILLAADDPEAGGSWGVRTYRGAGGVTCVTAGWIRGQALGQIENGRYRAYPPDQAGRSSACANDDYETATFAAASLREPVPRTLVFGQARPTVSRVIIDDGERTHVARVRNGVYLLVLSGDVSTLSIRMAGTE